MTFIEALPRSSVGKVQKGELMARAAELLAANSAVEEDIAVF